MAPGGNGLAQQRTDGAGGGDVDSGRPPCISRQVETGVFFFIFVHSAFSDL